MAYIGIGYTGNREGYLTSFFEKEADWISGERRPRFFGDSFVVLFDSNTSREIIKKITVDAQDGSIKIFPMGKEFSSYRI